MTLFFPLKIIIIFVCVFFPPVVTCSTYNKDDLCRCLLAVSSVTGGDIDGQSESCLYLVKIVPVLDQTRPRGSQSPVLQKVGIKYGLREFLVA